MQVRKAELADLEPYRTHARAAQDWLRARGLEQYVPAAHAEYEAAIHERVRTGTLYAVQQADSALAWFSFDSSPSPWWPADGARAVYLAGIVVAREARGQGLGPAIVRWCAGEARRLGSSLVRIDCHSGNRRLCAYYESLGFELQGKVEQHPGYVGCLYQLSSAAR